MDDLTTKQIGVVYTCITGEYDALHNHTFIDAQWDYVCFADDASINDTVSISWKIKPLAFDALDNVRNHRWHKLHPHILFPEYDKSIYIDANLNVLNRGIFDDAEKAIKESRKLSIAPHPERDCLYDEFAECIVLGKDKKDVMERQKVLIEKDGFPEKMGLFETNVVFREHHEDKIIAVMKDWWWWVKNYSRRDQLSLTYVLWKHGMTIKPLSDKTYRNSDKIEFKYGDSHITKEELSVQKEKLQQEVHNLNIQLQQKIQEVEHMKSSMFWKLRKLCLKIMGIFRIYP